MAIPLDRAKDNEENRERENCADDGPDDQTSGDPRDTTTDSYWRTRCA